MMISEKRRTMQSEKGFTLLEMIVAVTLVAMMALGLWSVFRTGLRAWSRGTETIDANQRQRNILDMVRKQLASAYPLTPPPDEAAPVAVNPIFHGTETGLSFISLNSLRFLDSPGLTLVHYEVVEDPLGGFTLLEREARYMGGPPDSESGLEPAGATPLFSNLTQCYFEYRSEEEENPWVREWDAEERGQLPAAVAVTMASLDADGSIRNHPVIVPIHATRTALPTNILNRGGFRGGRGVDLNIDDRLQERLRRGAGRETGRGAGRGAGRNLDGELQDILRRRLEREQGR
jgi:general secretion pathway protein J